MIRKALMLGFIISGLTFNVTYAEKFESGFSNDLSTQDTNLKLKVQPSVIKQAPPAINQAILPITPHPKIEPISLESQRLPAQQTAWTDRIKTKLTLFVQGYNKVRAPTLYEKQLEKLLHPEEDVFIKKKKKFIESIMDEVSNYGMYIVLILVLLIILGVIHKDKEKAMERPIIVQKQGDIPKKNLWDEDF